MKFHFSYFLFFAVLLVAAQDLTGKWVTVSSETIGFYEELNLMATNYGEDYYGHSYDTQSNGYCRYWLKGTFNGTTFSATEGELIKKSYNHVPTIMRLNYEKDESGEYLVGQTWTYTYNETFGIQKNFLPNFVRYKKASNKYVVYQSEDDEYPLGLDGTEQTGEFEEPVEQVVENYESKQKKKAERERKILEEQKKREEQRRLEAIQKEQLVKEEKELKAKTAERKNTLISEIRLRKQKEVMIEIWDFGEEDNDIVTIFVNDSILAKKIVIKSEVQTFKLKLDQNIPEYKLLFLANNLGYKPPNSAKIRIRYGNRQHNFKLFTDEENNAVIILKNGP